jgi:hypothetical protein
MTAAPTQRPTGITVLAVLAFIGGAFAVFGGLALMAAGAFLGAMGAGEGGGLIAALGAVAGVFFLIYAALLFAVGFGLLKRKRWAWYVALVAAGLQILLGLGSLLAFDIIGALLNLGIGGFVAWYLLSPPIQAWFGVAHKTPWKYKGSAA